MSEEFTTVKRTIVTHSGWNFGNVELDCVNCGRFIGYVSEFSNHKPFPKKCPDCGKIFKGIDYNGEEVIEKEKEK